MSKMKKKFNEYLGAVITEAGIFERKEWAAMLGVSEPAISQWTTGKTLPEASKLNSLIFITREQELSDYQKDKLNELVAVLDAPANEVLGDNASKVNEERLSGYLSKRLENDVENCLDFVFYDLKIELCNQVLREVDILKKDITKKIIKPIDTDNENFYFKTITSGELINCYSQKENRQLLDDYIILIKEHHLNCNENLKTQLNGFGITCGNDNTKKQIDISKKKIEITENKQVKLKQKGLGLIIVKVLDENGQALLEVKRCTHQNELKGIKVNKKTASTVLKAISLFGEREKSWHRPGFKERSFNLRHNADRAYKAQIRACSEKCLIPFS